ncbi:endonuclease VII domain-containing protein [Kitasatospora sp. RB6PN24]|nr:endonuclease VII domain-containing protein [Kitasatospora humi]
MYFEQDGQCAVASCVREAKCVDHDHVTGKVRGLLCQGCNVAIGFLESPEWMEGAHGYLVEHGGERR